MSADAVDTADTLAAVLERGSVPVDYQPIVHVATGEVVGFEALARPEVPGGIRRLQREAAASGRTAELDRVCRHSALAPAADHALPGSLAWFVNAEPAALTGPGAGPLLPRDVAPCTVVELTERGLSTDPVGLLRAVRQVRASGARIALDDVGVDPVSLALLAVVRPDVVKLDLSVLEGDEHALGVADAVAAYAERSGAAVLAEGVEDAHGAEELAALGATHVQGWLYGRPGPLPDRPAAPRTALPRVDSLPDPDGATPFPRLRRHATVLRAARPTMAAITRRLETQALLHPEPLALLATFAHREHFTAGVARRYARLTRHYAVVAALGPDLSTARVPGMTPVDLADDDGLCSEWNIVVIGPWYCAALSARDTGDVDLHGEHVFDYVLTHDRALVEIAAQVLAGRLARSGPDPAVTAGPGDLAGSAQR